MTEARPLLKVSQVATMLNLNLSHVYDLLRLGKIPGRVKINGSVRVDPDVFEPWLAERKAAENDDEAT